jgi:hypothetical protein
MASLVAAPGRAEELLASALREQASEERDAVKGVVAEIQRRFRAAAGKGVPTWSHLGVVAQELLRAADSDKKAAGRLLVAALENVRAATV